MKISLATLNAIDIYRDKNEEIKTMTYMNQCVLADIYNQVNDYYRNSSLPLFNENFINKVSKYLAEKDKSLKMNLTLLREQIEEIFFSCKAKIRIKKIIFQGLDFWGYEVVFSIVGRAESFAIQIPFIDNMSIEKFKNENFGKMTTLYCLKDSDKIAMWSPLLTSYDTKELGDSILEYANNENKGDE